MNINNKKTYMLCVDVVEFVLNPAVIWLVVFFLYAALQFSVDCDGVRNASKLGWRLSESQQQ